MGVRYCSREDVKRALDIAETARSNQQIDDAILAGAGTIEGDLHRVFYPWTGTRYFDWPNEQYARPWRLWLNQHDLISLTSLVVAGETLSPSDYILRPDHGPPFTHIEINLAGPAAFAGGDTHQRSIAGTGLWGFRNDEVPAGALSEALDASETDVDVTDGSKVGVGHILRCETERMIVTDRTVLDSGQNLGANIDALASATTVGVQDGTQFHVGEQILIDAEWMLIVEIAANNVIVKRAWDGSVLAAHTAPADVYVSRRLTVERGALGTTAASHLTATALVRHDPPALIRRLNVAHAMVTLEQESSAYGRTVGSGDNEREARGAALAAFHDGAVTAYGRKRKARQRSV